MNKLSISELVYNVDVITVHAKEIIVTDHLGKPYKQIRELNIPTRYPVINVRLHIDIPSKDLKTGRIYKKEYLISRDGGSEHHTTIARDILLN